MQEYIDGKCLSVGKPWSESNAKELLVELLKTLEYLQSLSPAVIHRDIKPTNIMKRKNGDYVLIDFGSTRAAIADATVGGSTVAGTFGYMAPEQFQGQTDTSTDIYGLGATIIALLAGRDASDFVVAIEPGKWKSSINVSEHLKDVLARMVEPVRKKRISNAREALKALEKVEALVKSSPRALTQDWKQTKFCEEAWWDERPKFVTATLVSVRQSMSNAALAVCTATLMVMSLGLIFAIVASAIGWNIPDFGASGSFSELFIIWIWPIVGGSALLYQLLANTVIQAVYRFDRARKRFLFAMRWRSLYRSFINSMFSRTLGSLAVNVVVAFLIGFGGLIYLKNTGGDALWSAQSALMFFIACRAIAYIRDPVRRYFDLSAVEDKRTRKLIIKLTRRVHTLGKGFSQKDDADIKELLSLRGGLTAQGRAAVDGLILLSDAVRGQRSKSLTALVSNPTPKTETILRDAAALIPHKENHKHLEHAWSLWQAAEALENTKVSS